MQNPPPATRSALVPTAPATRSAGESWPSVLYRSDIRSAAAALPTGLRATVEESIGGAVAAGATGPAASVVDAAQDAFASALHVVFLIAAALMAAGSLLYLRMQRTRDRARIAPLPAPPPADRVAAAGATPSADGEGGEEVPPQLEPVASGTCVPCCR